MQSECKIAYPISMRDGMTIRKGVQANVEYFMENGNIQLKSVIFVVALSDNTIVTAILRVIYN